MKQFSTLKIKTWWADKNLPHYYSMAINPDFQFEIVNESEKAIQIEVSRKSQPLYCPWKKWMPKSVIQNLEEVLK